MIEVEALKKLEKNKGLKRNFYSKGIWRNYALFPPALVLFMSLFGVVYMYNNDMLVSLNCIPFIITLLLGTVCFKSTRKYLIKKEVESERPFEISYAIPLIKEGRKSFWLLALGANRHNKYFLTKKKNEILSEWESYKEGTLSVKKNMLVNVDEKDVFVCLLSDNKKLMSRGLVQEEAYLIYTGQDDVKSILSRDLRSYLS